MSEVLEELSNNINQEQVENQNDVNKTPEGKYDPPNLEGRSTKIAKINILAIKSCYS